MTFIKSKKTIQTIPEQIDKSDLQVLSLLLANLWTYVASNQAKSRDKLVNHSCQFARVWFGLFPHFLYI